MTIAVLVSAAVFFLGITLSENASRAEVRAVYGGFGLAVVGLLGCAAVAPGCASRRKST